MASNNDVLGDVISLGSSSESEGDSTLKRPFDEADDSDRSSQDGGSSLRGAKRLKTRSAESSDPKSPTSPHTGDTEPPSSPDSSNPQSPVVSSSEEGEVNEDDYDPAINPAIESQPTMDPPSTAEASKGAKRSRKPRKEYTLAFMPATPIIFKEKLKLPALAQKKNKWQQKFLEWVELFIVTNNTAGIEITQDLIVQALSHCVNKGNKKARVAGRQAARSFEKSGQLATLLEEYDIATNANPQSNVVTSQAKEDGSKLESTDTQKGEGSKAVVGAEGSGEPQAGLNGSQLQLRNSNGSENGITSSQPVAEAQASELQRRYFPSWSNPANMCILCGREGHVDTNCPHQECKFCNGGRHWEYICPSRPARCSKCRQIGHSVASCTEKLSLTKDEGLVCAFCSGTDHLEDECTQMWRSFHPDSANTSKVVLIPASCATCGSDQHFASDCRLREGKEHNPTWTLANRERYIDATCASLTIEQAAAAAAAAKGSTKTNQGSEHRIRGHAARNNNIYYSESDDSEVEFLGRRAAKPRSPPGRIQVSSNIQMPRNARNRGSQRGRAQNQPDMLPPLPPGPPPRGPPPAQHFSNGYPPPPPPHGASNRGGGSRSRGPPQSLPPKPPSAASRDFRSVPPPPPLSQGGGQWDQRGGRGGGSRGGRGGGRKNRGRGR